MKLNAWYLLCQAIERKREAREYDKGLDILMAAKFYLEFHYGRR